MAEPSFMKFLTLVFIHLVLFQSGFPQNTIRKCVSAEHAEKFGHLIVQAHDGRFEPIHTLANDVIHKITQKDRFEIAGKGEMDAVQVFLDMVIDYNFWETQKIIYIRNSIIGKKIGIKGDYTSLKEIFPDSAHYKIRNFAEEAFHKKPAERNAFDREILKIDERVNLALKVIDASFLRIFPVENHPESKWIHWDDSLSYHPLNNRFKIINQDLKLPKFCYNLLFRKYLTEVILSLNSNDYSDPDKILNYILLLQRQTPTFAKIPDQSKIDAEVLYNKLQIFSLLKYLYAITCIFLLFFLFSDVFCLINAEKLQRYITFCFIVTGLLFLIHTAGLIFRWYLSDHAPWSNSYEILLFISWSGIFSGLCMIKSSRYVIAAAIFFAFAMLMTAEFSNFDPQLTNLVPQLKSFWLIFHVAVITIGYGFLGVSFFLGICFLVINLTLHAKNVLKIKLISEEITIVNEMNIFLGIVFTCLGTFSGAIWANESWGKYWGWDAKETWSLIIIVIYAALLHVRLISKFSNLFLFNVLSLACFATVLMTFFGVNYFLSKGQHTYASGEVSEFPVWAIIICGFLLILIFLSFYRYRKFKNL